MTRHLYRAKRKDNGAWVEGYYVLLHKTTIGIGEEPADNAVHQIVYERMTDWNLPNEWLRVEVDPETVCRCIGLPDNNGELIYEGDIVRVHGLRRQKVGCKRSLRPIGVVRYRIETDDTFFDASLKQWNDGKAACWCVDMPNKEDTRMYGYGSLFDCEVIGNIFDNPKLLKGLNNDK